MNLFSKQTKNFFHSDSERLKREDQVIVRQIRQIQALPVDDWLNIFRSLYIQGVKAGFQQAIDQSQKGYDAVTLPSELRNERRQQEILQQLVAFISDPESMESLAMERTVWRVLLRRNQVDQVDMLRQLAQPQISRDDLDQIFLLGWLVGVQYFKYHLMVRKLTGYDDSWVYKNARLWAKRLTRELGMTDLEMPRTHRFFNQQILTFLTAQESTMK